MSHQRNLRFFGSAAVTAGSKPAATPAALASLLTLFTQARDVFLMARSG